MTSYMHCRPYGGTNIPKCTSSFFVICPGHVTTSNYQPYTSSFHHQYDQAPPLPVPPPPPPVPKRRRRLEDPIITYASNYYATIPHQISQSSFLQPPPLPPRRIYQPPSDRNGMYCDLYNLLERPSPPSPSSINQRRKHNPNDYSPRRYHRPMDFENAHTKVKNISDQKCHHQQASYYKEKRHQKDKLSSSEQYDRTSETTKKMNHIYQRRSSNKGFFRRLVRNYFCMPSTVANNGYSS
jgi:hypothetical protein